MDNAVDDIILYIFNKLHPIYYLEFAIVCKYWNRLLLNNRKQIVQYWIPQCTNISQCSLIVIIQYISIIYPEYRSFIYTHDNKNATSLLITSILNKYDSKTIRRFALLARTIDRDYMKDYFGYRFNSSDRDLYIKVANMMMDGKSVDDIPNNIINDVKYVIDDYKELLKKYNDEEMRILLFMREEINILDSLTVDDENLFTIRETIISNNREDLLWIVGDKDIYECINNCQYRDDYISSQISKYLLNGGKFPSADNDSYLWSNTLVLSMSQDPISLYNKFPSYVMENDKFTRGYNGDLSISIIGYLCREDIDINMLLKACNESDENYDSILRYSTYDVLKKFIIEYSKVGNVCIPKYLSTERFILIINCIHECFGKDKRDQYLTETLEILGKFKYDDLVIAALSILNDKIWYDTIYGKNEI